jgi:hypothetical protein
MASLALAASTAWPLDGAKFALLTTGITRAAAVEIAGAPDANTAPQASACACAT